MVKKGEPSSRQKRSTSPSHGADCSRDQESLYPADPEPPAPAQAFVSGLFISDVAEHIPTTLRKMPRLSEPGPLGMRAEHWYDFRSLAENSDLFVQVVAHKAEAAIPHSVLQYLKPTDHFS